MSEDRPGTSASDDGPVSTADRPATFSEVFANSEYRAVYLSVVLAWMGDYLARAAVTVLVYQQSDSVLQSAAAFAVSYLPWLLGGPLLTALAERFPYRRVMAVCDAGRMLFVLLLLIPGIPVLGMAAVLFLVTLGGVPAQAARSALLPQILSARQLTVAVAANATTMQAAQVGGYLTGATLAATASPVLAITIDALAFGLSSLAIQLGVRCRSAAADRSRRTHLMRETAAGFRMVLGTPLLRTIAVMACAVSAFAVVPEGLAAGWAAQGAPAESARGLDQGMIMAAGPIGFVIGGLLVSRLAGAALRHRLVRPFAVIAPLALVPALAEPPIPFVVLLVLISGVAQGGLMPTLNTEFVLALPHGYRARAFGVVQVGLQLSQGGAVVLTGLVAHHTSVPMVVGVWSVAGALLMLTFALRWPRNAPEHPIDLAPATDRADHQVDRRTGHQADHQETGNARHTRPRLSGTAGRMDG